MDQQIVTSSLFSFLLFLGIHVVIFSQIDYRLVLVWIIKTYLLGAAFPFLFTILFSAISPITGHRSPDYFLFVSIVSFLLYSLLVIGYILGVFGLMESSIRIRILEQVAEKGPKGLRINELYKNNNRDKIITKRIKRFIQSGDIIYKGGKYSFGNRFSFFVIHAFIFEKIKKLYSSK